jgi:hypothetical protein
MSRKKQGSDIISGDIGSDAALLAERQGIWIGTSGWTYDSWRGPFYPSEVPKKDWLTWYGSNFPSTEINASFYRTPSLEAARDWRERTPRNFVFAWKASKFITHWKRVNDTCANSILITHDPPPALAGDTASAACAPRPSRGEGSWLGDHSGD